MAKSTCRQFFLHFIFFICLLLFLSSCGAIGVAYTPPFIPVTFALDTSGNISITGNASIVTEIGTFSITAGVANTLQPADNTILLVIRHQQNGSAVDTAYQINTQEQVVVVVDGRTTIAVTNRRVMVDASQGDISCIEVNDSTSDSTCNQSPPPSGQTQPPVQTCSNAQGQRGPDHQADGADWTINSSGGGAFIVNFYFPNTQYNGNFKFLVPEGHTSITLHGGGGSYWLYQIGCETAAQNDFANLDHYTEVSLNDLESQGLVSAS